ncbi:cell division initiation protein [Desulfatibacillum alkenivorans DSM 16219]|jgi:cell division initiation protein|uniref:Cell division initiation protein n=1 Tax=Desulfatibacillum alkenivorans DSM 16219 TaxID=1121393 RepID=A0A1M6WN93_9BACT|nr:DivIVA domain-containing protein [Desulfatibacillum alkenivorans]SHK95240.1 cell division initiation protein [Desulfatibacillum alkenivorans DSM 16219]
MKITPMEIQKQEFKRSLWGLDSNQVESFLETVSLAMEELVLENRGLQEAQALLKAEVRGYKEREEGFRDSILHSRQVMEGMEENAKKEAELIVSQAEIKAEDIINRAHQSYAKVKDDITELKRQRALLDARIRGVLAAHKKILDINREESQALDSRDDKIAVFKKSQRS